MVFNICICVDLILMIKHPFVSKSKRITRYHIVSYTYALLTTLEKFYFEQAEYKVLFGDYLSIMQILAYVGFLVMGISSSVFAVVRLCKPGVSRELRVLILKRHVSYIICYALCNLYLLIQSWQRLTSSKGNEVKTGTWWINATEILYFS